MSTQTTQAPDPHRLVKCPNCGQYVHFDELESYTPQEYPKLLYKEKPKEKQLKEAAEPPEVETAVVNSPEEEKKKTGEGFSDEPPEPKADKADKGNEVGSHGIFGSRHEEPAKKK